MDPQTGELRRLSLRALVWIFLGLTAFFAAETTVELLRTGTPWSALHTTHDSASALTTTVSRSLNALLAMVLGFVSIAIPITANMYTPRLVEIFFSDRVNLAGLVFFAAAGAHALFAQWQMFPMWVPQTHVHVTWISGVLAFALVVPYYLYVLQFLNPTTIIRHVERRVVDAFPRDAYGPAQRALLHDRVLQLGNVVLRAVDRADRDVAIQSITALESVTLEYLRWKPRAPAAWYDVERELFPGLATEAIQVMRREETWVEHACLHQLRVAYLAALARMPDAVGAISAVTRRVAVAALLEGHDTTLGLAIRCFNTYVRLAVTRKDAMAVYDVLRQYRALAIELVVARPQRAREIAVHVRYYAELARGQGLVFVSDLAAGDVAQIVEAAYQSDSTAAGPILETFRTFRTEGRSVRMAKTIATLGAWFAQTGRTHPAQTLAGDLRAWRKEDLAAARDEVVAVDEAVFWEVTDRQTNVDYVEPGRRPAVLALLDDVMARLTPPAV